MKTIILFLLVGSASLTSSLRARRNVVQFGNMIECLTPRSAIDDYNGYGCWCGTGGSGTPLDGTDSHCTLYQTVITVLLLLGTWLYKPSPYNTLCKGTVNVPSCCRTHDQCYDTLKDAGTCSTWQLYTEWYSYSPSNCDTQSASISCGSDNNDCEAGLCLCDKTAAECFRSATFTSAYRDYNKDNC